MIHRVSCSKYRCATDPKCSNIVGLAHPERRSYAWSTPGAFDPAVRRVPAFVQASRLMVATLDFIAQHTSMLALVVIVVYTAALLWRDRGVE